MEDKRKMSELLKGTKPKVELVSVLNQSFASNLCQNEVFKKFIEYTFIYILAVNNFGYGSILFLISLWAFRTKKMNVVHLEDESDKIDYSAMPSWVKFPDFESVHWINSLLKQIWPHVPNQWATYFTRTMIQPKIQLILDRMNLEKASGFDIKEIDIGSVPFRLEGIKTYKAYDNAQIVMDVDCSFLDSDAKVHFTLHGIDAEIKEIGFRGTARIILKPFINCLPFIKGAEVYFLTLPHLEYSLGGIGTFADIPGVSNIIKEMVEIQLRQKFVWPNRLKITLPIDTPTLQDKVHMLRRPSGLLTVHLVEGFNLVIKDKEFLGHGTSDPYAILSLGRQTFNFRNKYISKNVNPKWHYEVKWILEEWFGRSIKVEIWDYDSSMTDDFMGKCEIPLSDLIDMDQNLTQKHQRLALTDTKHGEVYLEFKWRRASTITNEVGVKKDCLVSILVVSCQNLLGKEKNESNLYPRVRIKMNLTEEQEPEQTSIRSKTSNPIFDEAFLLESYNPSSDVINFEVINSKNSKVLGKAELTVDSILVDAARDNSQDETFDRHLKLSNSVNDNANIRIIAKIYFLD